MDEPAAFVLSNVHDTCIRLLKLKVKIGSLIKRGCLLALYETLNDKAFHKLKSNVSGFVDALFCDAGDVINPGSTMMVIRGKSNPCSHSTVMKDMCANCGVDLRVCEEVNSGGEHREQVSASVAMIHNIPELFVSQQQAIELGQQDVMRLVKTQKLVLLLDLDQTLIHTTNKNIPSNVKDVFHFQMHHGSFVSWYHTRLRPFTRQFLECISSMFELHICTLGSRLYAHKVARFIDPDEKMFSHRILSRDECFNTMTKTPNLKALFPCGDSMVCIIDDRDDVWNFTPNMVRVSPYNFFAGIKDINAPEKSDSYNTDVCDRRGDTNNDDCVANLKHSDTEMPVLESYLPLTDVILESDENTHLLENCVSLTSGRQRHEENVVGEEHSDIGDPSSHTDVDHIDDVENNVSICAHRVSEAHERDSPVTQSPRFCDTENVTSPDTLFSVIQSDANIPDCFADHKEKPKVNVSDCSADLKENGKSMSSGSMQIDRKHCINYPFQECHDEMDDDQDDYLLHLQNILTRIHNTFYEALDEKVKLDPQIFSSNNLHLPDLKLIIPYVKHQILKGCQLVFSGMVPLNSDEVKSSAWQTAQMLGAEVQRNIVKHTVTDSNQRATTHLVASRPGTNKHKLARRISGVQIVTGDWLWACESRWERCDERLFPLLGEKMVACNRSSMTGRRRLKRATCKRNSVVIKRMRLSSVSIPVSEDSMTDMSSGCFHVATCDNYPAARPGDSVVDCGSSAVTMAGDFINPLLKFSDDDLQCMDKEVDEHMEEGSSGSDEEEDEERDKRYRCAVLAEQDESGSSSESISGQFPRGWKSRHQSSRDLDQMVEKTASDESEEEENDGGLLQRALPTLAQDSSSSRESYTDSIGSVVDEISQAVEEEFLRC